MKNYVIGFSDGAINFATSCVYLVSCDTNSDRCQVSLINKMSKIAEHTKANKTVESILDKGMHGIWLAAANMVKIIQHIKETNIPIEDAYLGVDVLS